MREINARAVAAEVERLLYDASYRIGGDIEATIADSLELEVSDAGRAALSQIAENYRIARDERVAICQDTGMAVIFAEIGQDAHIIGGGFEDAVNEGVRAAYRNGYLRMSIVAEPLFDRVNTGDNTPAVIHTRLVPGETVRLLVMPKGFGSENMSRVAMLTPASGVDGVKRFVLETVEKAGPNACPPLIVGVGIGGTMEKAALIAKRMTARKIGGRLMEDNLSDDTNDPKESRNVNRGYHRDGRYVALEAELLTLINRTGIGPAGTGGKVTALAVNIGYYPTHIAGLPVAVNLCCHASRHAEGVL